MENGRILVVDADEALLGLLGEWLAREGCSLVHERPDVVIVDLPFPRERGVELLERVARDYPRAPIVALSSNFFPGIEASGAVARALGVASVLPKPLTRDALLAALQRSLP